MRHVACLSTLIHKDHAHLALFRLREDRRLEHAASLFSRVSQSPLPAVYDDEASLSRVLHIQNLAEYAVGLRDAEIVDRFRCFPFRSFTRYRVDHLVQPGKVSPQSGRGDTARNVESVGGIVWDPIRGPSIRRRSSSASVVFPVPGGP